MKKNIQNIISLFPALILISLSASIYAQAVLIPMDFGAFQPQQLNALFIDAASQDPNAKMMPRNEQEKLLNSRFPEISLPDVSSYERKFSIGNHAYINGNFDEAVGELSSAIKETAENLITLAIRTGFSDTVFQGNVYLIQLHSLIYQNDEEAKSAIQELLKLFPTRVPKSEDFPSPELKTMYEEQKPNSQSGFKLVVKVGEACSVRINGQEVGKTLASDGFYVYPGHYAVTKICGNQPVRAFIVPIYSDMTIDFEDEFSRSFSYPLSLSLNATPPMTDLKKLASFLITIGKRLEVKQVVGVGQVPSQYPSLPEGYNAILVDVEKEKIIRIKYAPPSELSYNDGMKDFVNALWTGEAYKLIKIEKPSKPILISGIVLLSIGAPTLISGIVTTTMAFLKNKDFNKISKHNNIIAQNKKDSIIRKRTKLALTSDILVPIGAALSATGIGLILLDLLVINKNYSELEFSQAWNFYLSPSPEQTSFHLQYRW